jgi:hypothetical protein
VGSDRVLDARRGPRGTGFARVVDGRIVEGHNPFDVASLLSQIGGHLTPPIGTLDDAVRAIARVEREMLRATVSTGDVEDEA